MGFFFSRQLIDKEMPGSVLYAAEGAIYHQLVAPGAGCAVRKRETLLHLFASAAGRGRAEISVSSAKRKLSLHQSPRQSLSLSLSLSLSFSLSDTDFFCCCSHRGERKQRRKSAHNRQAFSKMPPWGTGGSEVRTFQSSGRVFTAVRLFIASLLAPCLPATLAGIHPTHIRLRCPAHPGEGYSRWGMGAPNHA